MQVGLLLTEQQKDSLLTVAYPYIQVVRMRLEEGRRIVGTLIPGTAMEQLIKTMGQGAEEAEETIH